MQTIKEAASEFLASRRVAVTGVSRNQKPAMAATPSTGACATADIRCSR
jgi:hypothetical protein